jgi:hypothetical protein
MVNPEPRMALRRHTQGAFTIPAAAFLLAVALALAAPDSAKSVSPVLPSQQPAVPANAAQGESIWVRILVPFGAALGGAAAGAALGALLSYRYNRRLEQDRRAEAESVRRNALLVEGVDCVSDGLVHMITALNKLKGCLAALVVFLHDENTLVAYGFNARKDLAPPQGAAPEIVASTRSSAVTFGKIELYDKLRESIEQVDLAYESTANPMMLKYVVLESFAKEVDAVLSESHVITQSAYEAARLVLGDWPGCTERVAEAVAGLSTKVDACTTHLAAACESMQRAALPPLPGAETGESN